MSWAGRVLSQPPTSTTESMGWARIISSTSIDIKLRNIMEVGLRNTSPSEMVGKSRGSPPAARTPRFTASTRSGVVRWQLLKPLAAVAGFYVWIIRGTPLLVQLFVIFYGLPSAGILIDAFPAALIGFTLNVGAYSSEVIRAALTSISRGQWEAAYSIGMTTRQALRRTILPQATRVAVPPLGNTFISLVKDTSLAAALREFGTRFIAIGKIRKYFCKTRFCGH